MVDFVTTVGIWLGAYMILSGWSWLWKYNRVFRLTEHILVGSAAGYYLIQGLRNIMTISVAGVTAGRIWHIIPLVLGVSLFARYIKQYSWLQRYGTSYLVAGTMVIFFRATIVTQVMQQIQATVSAVSVATPLAILNSIIMVAYVCGTIFYFTFTEKFSTKIPGYNVFNKLGRYAFLTALGYYLGVTVMTRIAFVLNRLSYLYFDWLNLGSIL